MIRFLLDENAPHAIAYGLRARGIEVQTATDAGLLSADDPLLLAYAHKQRLVIFTQDDDYIKLHREGRKHAGIFYSKQGRRTLGEIIRFLTLASECLSEEDMVEKLEYF